MSKPEIVTTSDGSHSLYVKELDENYHSSHGAIQEAKHVFIKNGLEYFAKAKLSVLEVGFGTGLNALLTLNYAIENDIEVSYTGLETNLLDYSLVEKMNYLTQLSFSNYNAFFQKMHECPEGKRDLITPLFAFEKKEIKVQEYETTDQYDIVFYDAFSPTSQIEMWDISIFKKLHLHLNKGGILVTYCAKGQLKRDLREVGFEVESLPGPPGKREMVRAIKKGSVI